MKKRLLLFAGILFSQNLVFTLGQNSDLNSKLSSKTDGSQNSASSFSPKPRKKFTFKRGCEKIQVAYSEKLMPWVKENYLAIAGSVSVLSIGALTYIFRDRITGIFKSSPAAPSLNKNTEPPASHVVVQPEGSSNDEEQSNKPKVQRPHVVVHGQSVSREEQARIQAAEEAAMQKRAQREIAKLQRKNQEEVARIEKQRAAQAEAERKASEEAQKAADLARSQAQLNVQSQNSNSAPISPPAALASTMVPISPTPPNTVAVPPLLQGASQVPESSTATSSSAIVPSPVTQPNASTGVVALNPNVNQPGLSRVIEEALRDFIAKNQKAFLDKNNNNDRVIARPTSEVLERLSSCNDNANAMTSILSKCKIGSDILIGGALSPGCVTVRL